MDNKKTIVLNNGKTIITIDNRVNTELTTSLNNVIIEFKSETPVYTNISKEKRDEILKIINIEALELYLNTQI